MATEITAIVLDSGPIIKNEPSVSSLLKRTSRLITLPAVVNQEVRDAATRSRLQATLVPFLELRNPSPQSLRVVSEFAKKTGDAAVLSRVDLELLALTRDIEIELNGGDWRMRKRPGEKLAPKPRAEIGNSDESKEEAVPAEASEGSQVKSREATAPASASASDVPSATADTQEGAMTSAAGQLSRVTLHPHEDAPVSTELVDAALQARSDNPLPYHDTKPETSSDTDSASSDGWSTPSNLARHQASNTVPHNTETKAPTKLQCCLITSDFAVQNTALMMNLNLLSPSSNMSRIRHLRTYILRCHACFKTCKDTTRQFCPSCGGATLTRVTCSTDAHGDFKLHLKKNMQWNTRGDRYSIPKPVSGSASGKTSVNRGRNSGGKEGWGKELIFTEDQKEYERAIGGHGRKKERDLMDDDFLPAILSGARRGAQGRPRIGAGKNVNARKR